MLSTPPAFILSQDQTLKKCVHNQKCTKRLEAQNQACLILWLQTISYRADARQRTGFSLWAALRQIMSSVQVQHKLTSLYIPFYCFKGSFDRSLNVPVSPGCLVQRIFEDCICVSLFSYQGSQLFAVVRDSLLNISHHFIDVNTYFCFFKNKNGEGGIWTLAPLLTTCTLSRGVPSASWVLLHVPVPESSVHKQHSVLLSGEDGIRTHVPLRTNGFQDRLVMTTSIPLH